MWNTVNRLRASAVVCGLIRIHAVEGLSRVSVFFALLIAFAALPSCSGYDPLPPKTDAATSYYIPAAETPTQAEIDAMKAERDEYNELTK